MLNRVIPILYHSLIILFLTIVTQIGGLAWLLALAFRRRWLAFTGLYLCVWLLAMVTAPLFGRVPLPCLGEPLRVQSPLYCALSRHYVTPDLLDVAQSASFSVAERYPGTVTLALDGGFPFLNGFPLLPHLSHDDGKKLDFAFYYEDLKGNYLNGITRSPIGYWSFEQLNPNHPKDVFPAESCQDRWPSLRWDFRPVQPWFSKTVIEPNRTAFLVLTLAEDPRVAKLLLEPQLVQHLGIKHHKVRFQGCRAARHDDHLHIQL